jgi:hypothetical protein
MADKQIYITLSGLPLSFRLEWPFHKSTSGADFWVLHADVALENGSGLHSPAAINLSATVREVMPSLEPADAEGPVINALRKEVDRRQLEFLKSGKLVPVHFSSRHYDFKRRQWMFGKASDEELANLIRRKVYWQTKLTGGKVWLGDEIEAQYVQNTPDHLIEVASGLAGEGLFRLEREYATALPALMEKSGQFETEMQLALDELEKKHAFERG